MGNKDWKLQMKKRQTIGRLAIYGMCFLIVFSAAACSVNEKTQTITVNFCVTDDSEGFLLGETEQNIVSGEQTRVVTACPNIGYRFVSWSNGETNETITISPEQDTELYALFEVEELSLPVMQINTEDAAEIVSKEDYLTCTVTVSNADEEYCFMQSTARIRGRGNTSWQMPKKSYKLKFDSKVDLFGNGKAKTWTLIANYGDPSLLRNYFAYNIANALLDGLDYTTTTQNIELYVNGEYLGVYLVCEQHEAGTNRVDIDEEMQDENGEVKANTGYLLESDAYVISEGGIEDQDYFIVNEQTYAIKSPDTEEAYYIEHKDEFVSFIKDKVQTALDTLQTENTPENYELILGCIDFDSFVDGYVIDELFHLGDLEYTSFFLYYDNRDGLIHRGCIWDYDFSSGNCAYHPSSCSPDSLWAVNISWYRYLLQHDEFVQAVAARLKTLEENETLRSYLDKEIVGVYAQSDSFYRNFLKWDILGTVVWETSCTEELAAIDTWEAQVEYLRDWLMESLSYLVSVYCI